jgi:hypothetical protein
MRIKFLNQSNKLEMRIKKWALKWEKLFFKEKWDLEEMDGLSINKKYNEELERRLKQVNLLMLKLSGNNLAPSAEARLT